jgi:hypothetical protein
MFVLWTWKNLIFRHTQELFFFLVLGIFYSEMRDRIFMLYSLVIYIKIRPGCCTSKRVLTAGFVLDQLGTV